MLDSGGRCLPATSGESWTLRRLHSRAGEEVDSIMYGSLAKMIASVYHTEGPI